MLRRLKTLGSLGGLPWMLVLCRRLGLEENPNGFEVSHEGSHSCGPSKEETQRRTWNAVWNVVGSNPSSTP